MFLAVWAHDPNWKIRKLFCFGKHPCQDESPLRASVHRFPSPELDRKVSRSLSVL